MLLLVFLLPAIAHARISINIEVSSRKEDVKVNFKGYEQQPATESDLRAFGLSATEIRNWCVGKIRDKRFDTGIPLHESDGRIPTIERNTIKKTVVPIIATVLDLDSKPSVLAHHKVENNGTTTAEYTVDLEREVITSVTHTSEDRKHFNAYAEISAGLQGPVGVFIGNIGASASLSYDHQWGTSDKKSKKTTVRSAADLKVPVEPYHMMEATMIASHGSMDIEVVYDIYLSGSYILANKLFFPSRPSTPSYIYIEYSIDEFCKWAGIANRFQVTDIITIDFYSEYDTKLVTMPIEYPYDNYPSEDSDIVEEANGMPNNNSEFRNDDVIVKPGKNPDDIYLNSGSYRNNTTFWIIFFVIFYPIIHLHV